MSGAEPLLRGTIHFEGVAPSLSGATVVVRLEDVSRQDAPSRVVLEQVIHDVDAIAGQTGELEFCFCGRIADQQARYAVRVHVDLDGDGQVSPGDYISMESYPVLTLGYPDQVAVRVHQLQ